MAIKKLVRFDWAIKYILRNKANFDVLEAFISNLLKETIARVGKGLRSPSSGVIFSSQGTWYFPQFVELPIYSITILKNPRG